MPSSARRWLALAASALLLSGCASSAAGKPSAPPSSTAAPSASSQTTAPSGTTAQASKTASTSTAAPPSSTTSTATSSTASASTGASAATKAGAAPVPVMPEAVVIGNNALARPQAGLTRASVVWEILAEGWITRYLAIFSTTGANKIGPVRSARIYFDQLAGAYGYPYAHAGGNADALYEVDPLHIQNLDEIYGSGAYFWRGTTRTPPNNLYTSTTLLNAAAAADHFVSHAMLYPHQGALPTGTKPTAAVTLNYYTSAAYTYVVGWKWQGGWWYRSVNGSPLVTQSGNVVRAGTVIILVAQEAPDPAAIHTVGAIKILWQDGGQAWILRGGVRLDGTWALGSDGLPVVHGGGDAVLPAGSRTPIWYELVPTPADLQFTP